MTGRCLASQANVMLLLLLCGRTTATFSKFKNYLKCPPRSPLPHPTPPPARPSSQTYASFITTGGPETNPSFFTFSANDCARVFVLTRNQQTVCKLTTQNFLQWILWRYKSKKHIVQSPRGPRPPSCNPSVSEATSAQICFVPASCEDGAVLADQMMRPCFIYLFIYFVSVLESLQTGIRCYDPARLIYAQRKDRWRWRRPR